MNSLAMNLHGRRWRFMAVTVKPDRAFSGLGERVDGPPMPHHGVPWPVSESMANGGVFGKIRANIVASISFIGPGVR